nr:class I SAM-dependent methyltransferase [Rhizobium laguerreae]
MELNIEKLQTLLGIMINELGAAQNAALVIIGEELDLYRKMAGRGPVSSAELADATDTKERYVREWLSAQAASGFVDYEAATGKFRLSPEQAAVFAVDDSPVNMTGGFQALDAVYADRAKLTHAFRHGGGVSWTDRCSCMFCGTDRFFRPGYKANLVGNWLPSLDGVVEKLERGARAADVGCGFGSSTLMMATAFPKSQFTGIDFHAHSIEHASGHAGGMSNVRFETARAQDFEGAGFDLVTMFDALHDMGDPVGAVSHRQGPEAGWHADAGRADGGRQPGRQSQPRRPHLLRRLGQHLRPGLARPGSGSRPRRAGRPGKADRGAQSGRLLEGAACNGDTVQHGAGGSALTSAGGNSRRGWPMATRRRLHALVCAVGRMTM